MGQPQNRGEAVALYRFGIIAPATSPHLTPAQRGALVRELAGCTHVDPDGVEHLVSRTTLDRWIRSYRDQGLPGLMPTPRADTGALRRHPELFEEAAALRRALPSRSADSIAEALRARHGIAVSPRTIRSQLASRGLTRQALMAQPAAFGRYQAERVNQRWIGDYLIGPWIPFPKVAHSRRAKLVLFVDDKSRLLVHGVWGFAETTRSAQLAFKAAILRRGVPESLYLDRGAAFMAAPLRRCAGVLGIHILYSRPYRPQGRGKQERLNRFIRDRFILEAEAAGINDLEELNERFAAWCEVVCNTRIHAETNEAPIARFLAGGDLVFPDPERLTEAFRWSLSRRVSSTAAVDASLVGRRVECRFLPEDLTRISVYHEGKAVGEAVPFVISAHTHPQVRSEAPVPPAAGSGIDYLGLVLAASEDATPGRAIRYRSLPGPGEDPSVEGATVTAGGEEVEQR
jgi:putative transposase